MRNRQGIQRFVSGFVGHVGLKKSIFVQRQVSRRRPFEFFCGTFKNLFECRVLFRKQAKMDRSVLGAIDNGSRGHADDLSTLIRDATDESLNLSFEIAKFMRFVKDNYRLLSSRACLSTLNELFFGLRFTQTIEQVDAISIFFRQIRLASFDKLTVVLDAFVVDKCEAS